MGTSSGRFVLLVAVCGLSRVVLGTPDKTKKPNIVMIVADDLGWDDVSFHGSSQIPTPNIDMLANEGVILNSYYVSPICTPTRASLMTGKHPINLGVQHATVFGTQPYGLPLGETTTPQYMKSLGYATHGIGKWHLGFFEKEYTPTYRGFDSYYGFWNGKEDYWDHTSQEDVWGMDLRDNEKSVKNESGHYGTELFAERAAQVIHLHNQSKPLYLYLAQQGVHSANGNDPLQAPKRLIEKFSYISSHDRQIYAAMVASLDESVATVHKALRESGMLDNTVLVFTTDNGGAPRGFNWNQGSNYPLKGGKDTFWEGGVRGVGFVHSNLLKKKGRVSHELIDVTDWLPTFYQLGGGNAKQIQGEIDGMNMWDTISQGASSPRTEVLHNIDPFRKFAAIRVNNFKVIVNQDAVYETTWWPRYEVTNEPKDDAVPKRLPGAVVDCGKWNKKTGKACDTNVFPCLFDLSSDPCEYNNIAEDNLPIVRKLLQRLIQHQHKARPAWFPDRDPAANPINFKGFWSPWKENPANKGIIDAAVANIAALTLSNTTSRGTVYRGDQDVTKLLNEVLSKAKHGDVGKQKKADISEKETDRIYRNMRQLYRGMERKIHDKEKDGTKKRKHIKNPTHIMRRELSRTKRWEDDGLSTGNQHGIEISQNKRLAKYKSQGSKKHRSRNDGIETNRAKKKHRELETTKTVRKMLKLNVIGKHEGNHLFEVEEKNSKFLNNNDDEDVSNDIEDVSNDIDLDNEQVLNDLEGNDDDISRNTKHENTKAKTATIHNRSEIPKSEVRKKDILSALTELFRQ